MSPSNYQPGQSSRSGGFASSRHFSQNARQQTSSGHSSSRSQTQRDRPSTQSQHGSRQPAIDSASDQPVSRHTASTEPRSTPSTDQSSSSQSQGRRRSPMNLASACVAGTCGHDDPKKSATGLTRPARPWHPHKFGFRHLNGKYDWRLCACANPAKHPDAVELAWCARYMSIEGVPLTWEQLMDKLLICGDGGQVERWYARLVLPRILDKRWAGYIEGYEKAGDFIAEIGGVFTLEPHGGLAGGRIEKNGVVRNPSYADDHYETHMW